MELYGRKIIYTQYDLIDRTNVVDMLNKANSIFTCNREQVQYLYNYYRGKTPILNRIKEIRAEICNKINVNKAYEIVRFKVGYQFGEPLQYISCSSDEDVSANIGKLNDYMRTISGQAINIEVAEWQMICGTAYKMILPNPTGTNADVPFEIYSLDPREAFVVYSRKIGHKPVAGVYIERDENNIPVYCIYTNTTYFEVKNGKIEREEPYTLGFIPIIEYPANSARIGAFELVIPLINALNTVASNRVDGIEQFVSSLLVLYNCDLEEGTTAAQIRQQGMVLLKSIGENKADIKQICDELNQTQTQTLVDNMEDTILTICAMPNRGGGGSTSDNGVAVVYRDGWSDAETFAKQWEGLYVRSEVEALKLMLHICELYNKFDIDVSDITCKFTRRNYENIQTKAQVLTTLLASDKVHPRLAFEMCGAFPDVEEAYRLSMEWYEQNKSIPTEEIITETDNSDTNNTDEDSNTEILTEG